MGGESGHSLTGPSTHSVSGSQDVNLQWNLSLQSYQYNLIEGVAVSPPSKEGDYEDYAQERGLLGARLELSHLSSLASPLGTSRNDR